jgi:hypothetical protein
MNMKSLTASNLIPFGQARRAQHQAFRIVLPAIFSLVACSERPTEVGEDRAKDSDVPSSVNSVCEGCDEFDPNTPGYIEYETPDPGVRGGFPNTPFPGTFAESTYVHARAEGVVNSWYADSWVWPQGTRGTAMPPLDPNGWAWGGAFQCVGNLEISYLRSTGGRHGVAFCTRNNTNLRVFGHTRTIIDTSFVLIGTSGLITRLNSQDTGPSCGFASYPACYTYVRDVRQSRSYQPPARYSLHIQSRRLKAIK